MHHQVLLDLHSILVLLKVSQSDNVINILSTFTFYSSSIKGAVDAPELSAKAIFTFYSSSIKGVPSHSGVRESPGFTFYSSSIKGALF